MLFLLSFLALLGCFNGYTPQIQRQFKVAERHQRNTPDWIDKDGSQSSSPEFSDASIRIVSYNVLGPIHGEGQKHSYAPEISSKGLKETFIPGLKHVGMECCAYAPGRDDVAKGKFGGHKSIGCAIFMKSSRFTVVESKRVYLRDYAKMELSESQKFAHDVMSKSTSMAIALLKLKDSNQTLIVATTHLFWDPARADIKTIQTKAAADAITAFCKGIGCDATTRPPIIFCGDLNTVPGMGFGELGPVRSAPFELLTQGRLDWSHQQHPDSWSARLEGDNRNPRLGSLTIDFKFNNAYLLPEFEAYKPLFTTKTDDFAGWIDHIFVDQKLQHSFHPFLDKLNSRAICSRVAGLCLILAYILRKKVEAVLSPPICSGDLEANIKARKFTPIPNKDFPSDHLPIGCIATIR